MTVQEPQSTRAVLMVRPAQFGFNPQTAGTNLFQRADPHADDAERQSRVLAEFDGLAAALSRAGVQVIAAADSADPPKPDALFPNNWVSFHGDGSVVLYPMLAPNRRLERREDLIAQVAREGSFRIVRTVDLSHREAEGKFLEGTGSLVLDRAAHVAYACLSPRTDLDVLGEFAQLLDYELMTFDAEDGGAPIYHTNVLMAVGTRFAVICAESIGNPQHRDAVVSKLAATGHEIIEISLAQMRSFAGNLLELEGARGRLIAVSGTAWSALDARQRRQLESHGEIIAADIATIERLGGGSVRCMLAEIHLPRRAAAA
jgi:hypothetical protein